MILVADLDVIAGNAAHAKTVAAGAGCGIVGVIKDGYAKVPIVRAFLAGGIRSLGFSSPQPATDAIVTVARSQRLLIAPSLASGAGRVAADFASSTHSSPASIKALAGINAPHSIYLALRTIDDREGFSPDDNETLHACVAAAAEAGVSIAGVLANFGCRIERAPTRRQIEPVYRAADLAERLTGSAQSVSLGGSVLLDCDLRGASHPTVLRIGEAIIAGTIPGRRAGKPFQAPFILRADVVEARKRNTSGPQRVLINAGWTHFDVSDAALQHAEGRIVHASAECSVIDLLGNADVHEGDEISIRLGYKSIVRANLNSATQMVWQQQRRDAGSI